MDFVPQPEEAKKFPSIKWLKWNITRYPGIFFICLFVPPALAGFVYKEIWLRRGYHDGTHVPDVLRQRYAVVRSDDYTALRTPKRYLN